MGGVAQLPGSEINLLEGSVDVAAAQQMVDGLRAGGVGPLEKAPHRRAPRLTSAAVPVPCDFYGILRLHVGGPGVNGGDPRRQPGAGVGPHGQLRAVQGAQRRTACAASRAARR